MSVNSQSDNKAPHTFAERVKANRTTRWIRFGVVSVIYILWVIWMGNPWLLLGWLLLFDIYITGYIPFTWWKRSQNRTVRKVMGWVDAIVYALVLVYFIFAFIGQNYQIPSSSLEKSLLVGDYLWTNKTIYGPRVPQTPIHFPLAQHTLPVLNTKSYSESLQLSYHRLPGLRSVERGDIVVFNFPTGDTVATGMTNPDYYQIKYALSRQGVADPAAFIAAHPEQFGRVVWRPVDRRENFVKRAVGLPGEVLEIKNDTIFINGVAMSDPKNVQYNYVIPVSAPITREQWQEIGVREEDSGSAPMDASILGYKFYSVPLTAEAKKVVEKWPQVNGPLRRESALFNDGQDEMFPLGAPYGWSRTNMGPIWIPKRGRTLELTLNNLPLYRRAIEVYEGNKLEARGGQIYINDKPATHYTFKMDYYWMMGDNRDRSADSRYWGFVPEDHIVGAPQLVLCSFDQEKGWFSGRIRLDRILRNANPQSDRGMKP